ncbi:tRNA (Guanine-N(7))-methyltransferase domain protein, partial [Vibrio parahaemolyticus V-223/04]
GACIQYFP